MFKKLRKIFNRRFNRFYRRSRLYIMIDIILLLVVLVLGLLLIRLYSYQPNVSLYPWSSPKEEPIAIDLNNPPLSLSYESKSTSIYWQDGANIILRLKNNGSSNLKNLKLNVSLDNKDFSLSRLEFASSQKTSLSGLEIKGFDLYLDELTPGTDREVALNISFQKNDASARVISTRIDTEYEVAGQIIKESLDLADFKVASEVTTSARAYYNSPQGDQLGSGAFPPISTLPTSLWVFFQAEPHSDFSDFVMSGRLANNVEFANNYSLLSGELKYNKDTRQIVWQVANLNASDRDDYRAGFEITLIASEDQVGSYANLLSSIRFQAIDYFTGLPTAGNLANIDTSLKHDAINRDEGIVTSIENY